jgi:uncharacterized protein YyaL (SSP411 family)
MLNNLARLFFLTGDDRFRIRAESLIEAFDVDALRDFPHTCSFLNGFELFTDSLQVIVIGDRSDPNAKALLSAALSSSHPNLILSTVNDKDALPADHAAYGKSTIDGKVTAYVCRGPLCQAPVTSPDDLRAALVA